MSQEGITQFIKTDHSSKEGTAKIKDYINAAKERGINALALIDNNSLAMAVPFFDACQSTKNDENTIKPIIGSTLKLESDDYFNESDLVVIAKNDTGYLNLKKLISLAYFNGQYKLNPQNKEEEIKLKEYLSIIKNPQPLINNDILNQYNEGLVIIMGNKKDFIGKALLDEDYEKAIKIVNFFKKMKNEDFILSIQKNADPQDKVATEKEKLINEGVIRLSYETEVPVVINNEVKFINKEDFSIHELKKSILDGDLVENINRKIEDSPEQYLKTLKEIEVDFEEYPEIIENTKNIQKISDVTIDLGNNYLPAYEVPTEFGQISEAEYMRIISEEGMLKKLKIDYPNDWENRLNDYQERLKKELDIINGMGFPGYFLIVQDFIKAAKDMGVPVGPGRGSGAGSLVAYGLDITDIDPIKYSLFFERFLNPERVSMPDFDIDFSKEVHKEEEKSDYLYATYGIPKEKTHVGREDVINYVANKYNKKDADFMSVTQIITEGTFGGKSAIRDVARAMDISLNYVDSLLKEFKNEMSISVAEMLEVSEELNERYETEPVLRELMESAKKIEGKKKSNGIHAGGVIIAPGDITKFSPIQCEPDKTKVVTQFNMKYAEEAGLVKFDFLGLETLTVIHTALRNIKKSKNKNVDVRNIPLDDEKTFELLRSAKTKNVFQLESAGMRELIKKLEPTDFSEISALVALYRPGPLQSGMTEKFVEGKKNPEAIEIVHPDLKDILSETYGTIVYQEQIQQAAQKLANYTLGAADQLRRAMGKKKPEEMQKHQKTFILKAAQNYRDEVSEKIKKHKGYDCNIDLSDIKLFTNLVKDTEGYIATKEQVFKLMEEMTSFSSDDLKEIESKLHEYDDKKFSREIFKRIEPEMQKYFLNKGHEENQAKQLGTRTATSIAIFNRFNHIFTSIEKFAAYGFNKSHSVAYAKLTYETAYLKANYPAEFMAADLSSNMKEVEKIGEIIQETRTMGIKILPPNVNKSELEFVPEYNEDTLKVRYGLEAIKGVGKKELNSLFNERKQNGEFKSFNDFVKRMGKSLNKRSIEAFSLSGALDELTQTNDLRNNIMEELTTNNSIKKEAANRLELLKNHNIETLKKEHNWLNQSIEKQLNQKKQPEENEIIENIKKEYQKLATLPKTKKISKKDYDTFDKLIAIPESIVANNVQELNKMEKLNKEHEILGTYISAHPLYINNNYNKAKEGGEITFLNQINSDLDFTRIAGVLLDLKKIKIKKQDSKLLGRTMGVITIDDGYGQQDVTFFPDQYDEAKDYLKKGNVLCIDGELKTDDFGLKVTCQTLTVIEPEHKVINLENKMRQGAEKKRKNKMRY